VVFNRFTQAVINCWSYLIPANSYLVQIDLRPMCFIAATGKLREIVTSPTPVPEENQLSRDRMEVV
jgi:hypothetical protein